MIFCLGALEILGEDGEQVVQNIVIKNHDREHAGSH